MAAIWVRVRLEVLTSRRRDSGSPFRFLVAQGRPVFGHDLPQQLRDFPRPAVGDRAFDGPAIVFDEEPIALVLAVPIDGDGLVLLYKFSEFVDGQVRPLSGAVNGEKTQACYGHAEKMMVCMTYQFASFFCRGIRRNREINVVILGEGDFFVITVNAGA